MIENILEDTTEHIDYRTIQTNNFALNPFLNDNLSTSDNNIDSSLKKRAPLKHLLQLQTPNLISFK